MKKTQAVAQTRKNDKSKIYKKGTKREGSIQTIWFYLNPNFFRRLLMEPVLRWKMIDRSFI